MSTIKAIAVQSFVHNRHSPRRGETIELTAGEFRDLEQAGLVKAEAVQQPQQGPQNAQAKPAPQREEKPARTARNRAAPDHANKEHAPPSNKGGAAADDAGDAPGAGAGEGSEAAAAPAADSAKSETTAGS